jgi:hypothetical protein
MKKPKFVSVRPSALSGAETSLTGIPAQIIRESSLSITVKLLVGIGAYKAGELVNLRRWDLVEGEKVQ